MSDTLTAGPSRSPGPAATRSRPTSRARGGDAPRGGVVVIHHMPGYDRATKEIVRRFAELGYDAICPNLYYREAPGAGPDDAAAVARAPGGVPDERLLGDVDGARGVPARAADLERQGRRDRALLRRPAGGPGRVQPRPRRRRRLLRRVRDRRRRRPTSRSGHQPRRPAAEPARARCSACSATRTSHPSPDAGRRAGADPARPAARRTSSTATTTPATRSSPSTGRPTGSPRPTTAGSGSPPSSPRHLA